MPAQGFIQTSLIWVTYAVAIAILFIISSVFVYIYQKPKDRSLAVTLVCIFTILSLLATVLLLPVDVALVSSTVRSSEGIRKPWATQDRVDDIIHTLKIVYYTLYSVDAVLCLIVVPFTYFFYEEYDEVEAEEGRQGVGSRLMGALKYTIFFLLIAVALFLVGFFIPINNRDEEKHKNLDYLLGLLLNENRGERALTFGIGALITIGTFIYALYSGAGLALLPVTMIKSAPAISAPDLAANTSSELERNRERQAQLEARNEGREAGLDPRDRRELEALLRDERTLVRRERLAAENLGENQHILLRAWHKTGAVLRPLKLIFGLLLMIVGLLIFVSMLITGIDKAKNSVCKAHCGYILAHIEIFQPVNWILTMAAQVFPIDYAIFLLLVLFFFASSVVGIAVVGIRFLWLHIFHIRQGHTSPQAMLLATILLGLMVLALNYAIVQMVAPQYATYGPQTFCDRPALPNEQPDCSGHVSSIKPCTEFGGLTGGLKQNPVAKDICTPSVVSTFLNRININFPFFGVVDFWAQFAFLGIYLIVGFTTLIRTPKVGNDMDGDLEEEEEEGLLGSTGRRFNATWHDITGRARKNNPAPHDEED